VPLAYYLMGARKTISLDLNPYLKSELIADALQHISENSEQTRALFGALLDQDRFSALLSYCRKGQFDSATFFDLCGIDYIAPGDAANAPLPSHSVDFHTSNTTLEHIPREVLLDILREGNRILRDNGLFIHRIDYTDHFSHSDNSISPINFLQYSDKEWRRYANNRYMYMNRLRHDDLLEVFQLAGHRILGSEPDVNQTVLESVSKGRLRLAERFAHKPLEVIATTGAWIITKKGHAGRAAVSGDACQR
jgi:SAM-dependent methyltransferase